MSVAHYLKVRSEDSFSHRTVINALPSCPAPSPNKGLRPFVLETMGRSGSFLAGRGPARSVLVLPVSLPGEKIACGVSQTEYPVEPFLCLRTSGAWSTGHHPPRNAGLSMPQMSIWTSRPCLIVLPHYYFAGRFSPTIGSGYLCTHAGNLPLPPAQAQRLLLLTSASAVRTSRPRLNIPAFSSASQDAGIHSGCPGAPGPMANCVQSTCEHEACSVLGAPFSC